MLGIANVDDSTICVSTSFHAITDHLNAIHNILDNVQSLPYIPSIRQNALAHCSDKVNNLQENIHALRMALAHLG